MASERDYNYINSISAVGGRLQCYRRMGAVSDVVELEIKPFLLSDFFDVPHAEEICKLTGNNPLCYKAVFADCASYELAADELKSTTECVFSVTIPKWRTSMREYVSSEAWSFPTCAECRYPA